LNYGQLVGRCIGCRHDFRTGLCGGCGAEPGPDEQQCDGEDTDECARCADRVSVQEDKTDDGNDQYHERFYSNDRHAHRHHAAPRNTPENTLDVSGTKTPVASMAGQVRLVHGLDGRGDRGMGSVSEAVPRGVGRN
jgi:hypothetical protein